MGRRARKANRKANRRNAQRRIAQRKRDKRAAAVVFVYGTLQRGQRLAGALARSVYLGTAETENGWALWDVAGGGYPGMLPDATAGTVKGELYRCDAATVADLDRIEGCPDLYVRRTITLADGRTVAAYAFPAANLLDLIAAGDSCPPIPGGDWKAYRADLDKQEADRRKATIGTAGGWVDYWTTDEEPTIEGCGFDSVGSFTAADYASATGEPIAAEPDRTIAPLDDPTLTIDPFSDLNGSGLDKWERELCEEHADFADPFFWSDRGPNGND